MLVTDHDGCHRNTIQVSSICCTITNSFRHEKQVLELYSKADRALLRTVCMPSHCACDMPGFTRGPFRIAAKLSPTGHYFHGSHIRLVFLNPAHYLFVVSTPSPDVAQAYHRPRPPCKWVAAPMIPARNNQALNPRVARRGRIASNMRWSAW